MFDGSMTVHWAEALPVHNRRHRAMKGNRNLNCLIFTLDLVDDMIIFHIDCLRFCIVDTDTLWFASGHTERIQENPQR